jgi:hypothetical protein
MNQWLLKSMYQQWADGQEDLGSRWLNFVEMAARTYCTTNDEVMKELQKCSWFIKED